MAHAMWTIVFFSLLAGGKMWPLPSAPGQPKSMYDICTQTDLHQIEALKETLFDGLNKSINLDENRSLVPFGLLDEDWTRLQDLENRIPEESELKSKLLIVFRILIAAIYQAHGTSFENPVGLDGSILGNEERNGIEYEDEITSNEFEFGSSNHDDVVVNDFDSNTRTTSSKSFDENVDESKLFDYMSPENNPFSSGTTSTISAQKEYKNNVYSEYSKMQTTLPVTDDLATTSKEDAEERSHDPIFVLVNEETTSTSNPTIVYTGRHGSNETTEESTVSMINKHDENEDESMVEDRANNTITLKDYFKSELNDTTSERLILQQNENEMSSEYISTAYEATPRGYINLNNPSSNSASLEDSRTALEVSTNSKQDHFDTTVTVEDVPAHLVYPELVELILLNNKIFNKNINQDNSASHKELYGSLNDPASTTEPWVNNHLFDDMDGFDSIINEVILPKPQIENEIRADSSVTEENINVDTDTAYRLTDSQNLSNYQFIRNLNQSDMLSSSRKYDVLNELSTTNPNNEDNNLIYTTSAVQVTCVSKNGVISTEKSISKNFENISSVEKDNFQKSSVEKGILVATEDATFDSSEHISSAEINSIQKSSNEKGILVPTEGTISKNSEHMSSEKEDNLQKSSKEKGVLVATEDNISEGSEHILSAEKDNLHRTSAERGILVPTEGTIPKSSEHISSAEEDINQRSTEEKGVLILTEDGTFETRIHISSAEKDNLPRSSAERGGILVPTEGTIPKSSEHISSAEEDINQKSTEEKGVLVLTEDGTFETSKHISSAEKDNLPRSSAERGILFPIEGTISKSSEHISSEEEDINQRSSEEKGVLVPTEDGTFETSKHISSAEKDTLLRSSAERVILVPTEGTISKISELISSAEENNMQSSSKEKDVLVATEDNISEKSEYTLSAEEDNLPRSSAERDILVPTEGTISKSSEHTSSAEEDINKARSNEMGVLVPTEDNIFERSEHISSAENNLLQDNGSEGVVFSSVNSSERNSKSHLNPNSSEQMSSTVNDELQRNSTEGGLLFSTKDTISEISEHISSAEKDILQSAERGFFVLTEDTISENSKHISSSENDRFQKSSEERDVFSPENSNGPRAQNSVKPFIPGSSEYFPSAENDHLLRSTTEKGLSVHTENTISKSSVHMSTLDKDSLQISSVEKDVFSMERGSLRTSSNEMQAITPTNDGENPISLASEASMENKKLFASSIESSGYSPVNEYVENPADSSEHISSSKKDEFQNRFNKSHVLSPMRPNNDYIAVQFIPERSEQRVLVENKNTQDSIAEQNLFVPSKNVGESPAVEDSLESSRYGSKVVNVYLKSSMKGAHFIPTSSVEAHISKNPLLDSSEHKSSMEDLNLPISAEEDETSSSRTYESLTTDAKATFESSEHMSSAENVQMLNISTGKGALSQEDRPNFTHYSGVHRLHNRTTHSTDDSEEADYDVNIQLKPDSTNLPLEVDDEKTATEPTKESYRTFNVFFSKLSDSPLPTQSYIELPVYPLNTYTYWPSSFLSKRRCQNGNDCVHVRHVEYKSNDNPLSTRIAKHVSSRYKSKETTKAMEDLPEYFLSPTEDRMWLDKLSYLKGSTDE